VLGDADWLRTDEQVAVAIAVGSPAARRALRNASSEILAPGS
jgi:hypothetical protein